ncbi:MAG: hypothetical protein ACRDQ0_21645, partial [Pseudonocardia sp.]
RAHLLAVSDAGLAALAEYRAMRARRVAEALAGWDDAEVGHLTRQLDRLMQDLHRELVLAQCGRAVRHAS